MLAKSPSSTVSISGHLSRCGGHFWLAVTVYLSAACAGTERPIAPVTPAQVAIRTDREEMVVGDTAQLSAVVSDSAGRSLAAPVAWSVSDTSIGKLTGAGTLSRLVAQSPGAIVVYANAGGRRASLTLSVRRLQARFTVDPIRAFIDSALSPAPEVSLTCGELPGSQATCRYPVRLQLVDPPAGVLLSGTMQTTSVNGVARFPDVRINRAVPGLRLRAIVTAPAADTTIGNRFEIVPLPAVVDSSTAALVSTPAQMESGTLVYRGNLGTTIQPGAVIVGSDNGGYLRKVESVVAGVGVTVVQTQPSTISEAIRDANVDSRISVLAPPVMAALRNDAVSWGPTEVTYLDPAARNLGGRIVIGPSTLWSDGESKVAYSGGLTFSPEVELKMRIADWQIRQMSVTASGSVTLNASAEADLRRPVSLEIEPKVVTTLTKPFAFTAGPIPVFGRVELIYSIRPIISAEAQGYHKVSATATGGVRASAIYTAEQQSGKGTWSFDAAPAPNTSFAFTEKVLTGKGNVQVRFGIKTEARLWLYETVGPYVWSEPYIGSRLSVDLARGEGRVGCFSGLDLGIGVTAKIFSLVLADWKNSTTILKTDEAPFCTSTFPIFVGRTITRYTGDAQREAPGNILPAPIVVRVVGSIGEPSAGVEVDFVVTGGGGSVDRSRVTTGGDGLARVNWRLGGAVGRQLLEARLAGANGSPVVFTAEARSEGTLGGVVVDDATSQRLPFVNVGFACGAASFPGTTTNSNGEFVSGLLPKGTCTATATLAGYEAKSVNGVVEHALIGSVGTIRLSKSRVNTLRGIVRDAWSNAVVASATVALERPGSSTPLATAVTASDGRFQFDVVPFGTYVLNVSGSAYTSQQISATIDGSPAIDRVVSLVPDVRLHFVSQPTTGRDGDILEPVVLAIRNASGQPVTNFPLTVSLRLAPTSPTGTLSGGAARLSANGSIRFDALRITGSGNYRVLAASEFANMPTATSGIIEVRPRTTAALTGLTVAPTTMPLLVGEGKAITATPSAQPGAMVNVSYASLSPTVASVSQGFVYGIQPGQATVRVSAFASGPGMISTTLTKDVTVIVSGRFSMTLGRSVVNLTPGLPDFFGPVPVSFSRQGYSGAITLSVSNLPQGITANVAQPGTGNSGSITFSSSTSTEVFAPRQLTVTASGVNGQLSQDRIDLIQTPGSLTTAVSPTDVSLSPLSTANVTISLTRQNYYWPVTLAVGPLPPGVSASIVNPNTGSTGTLRFSRTGGSFAPTNVQISINAPAIGTISRTVTLRSP